jgi:DNA topoisomerase-1
MDLIIVESPTKAKTLQKFLGGDYKILSSYGHVRDLPKTVFGVDIENNFAPKYALTARGKTTVKELKAEVKKADRVFLSTDPDREGEAIAWHLVEALKLDKPAAAKIEGPAYRRIEFHEITENAIQEALKNPREINFDLVNAQQARRVLDRIVGYQLSPFLWKKIVKGLSAGRVQSVAVRLIAEREREIKAFNPEEYWEISATLKNTENKPGKEFSARLVKINNATLDKLEIKDENRAIAIEQNLENAAYAVSAIEKKESRKKPSGPFTTSTLQQTAWQRFKMTAKATMMTAQQLYEMGLITYHRTDSLNLSVQSLSAAKNFIAKTFGENYHPGHFNVYKTKAKGAQEAHEAIRPAYADQTPEMALADKNLSRPQAKLYELIWQRFIASQMAAAVFDSLSVDIAATGQDKTEYIFRANGQTLKFDGYLKVYPSKFEELDLPAMASGEPLEFIKLNTNQHFTKPPARYNEATLIKALEAHGIGRPSTYAPIISTIQTRNYIEKDEKKSLKPTEIGLMVNDLLVAHFPQIVDIGFTAKMEEEFDRIADGRADWVKVLRDFYDPFKTNLDAKYQEVEKKNKTPQITDKICPKCGANLVVKMGRFGKFYACPKFPECKHTENMEPAKPAFKHDIPCPKCGTGHIVEKKTKKRKIFYGCSAYPDCDFALWDKPTGAKCEKCGALMITTKRKQVKCSNKECSTNARLKNQNEK